MVATELQHFIASRVLCPQCHALTSATADRCTHCCFDFGWTRAATCHNFRQTLSANGTVEGSSHWEVELRAELVWPTGNCHFLTVFDEHVSLDLPFGQRLSFRILEDGDRLEVVCGDTTVRVCFPCRDVELESGLKLHAGLFVRRSDVDQPRDLGPNVDKEFSRPLSPLNSARQPAEFTVGRVDCSLSVPDQAFCVGAPHFVIAVEPATSGKAAQLWLANSDPQGDTFVNQQRVWVTRLQTNDVIQVGSFGWAVWLSDSDFGLISIARIKGVGLVLDELRVRNLQLSRLEIEPGEFVALCGPSGAGKSTLLKAIGGVPGFRPAGRLLIREDSRNVWDASTEPDRFRQLLGYVSQESVLHDSLNPRQVLWYAAALRGQVLPDPHIEWLLHRAEIPPDVRALPIRCLSGGENKRLRTTAELASLPRLLLLDEPDSGLDAERRRRLLKHLKTLSRQGCTVIMISHGSNDLLSDGFDRVIRLENQTVAADSRSSACSNPSPKLPQVNGSERLADRPKRGLFDRFFGQFLQLVRREFELWLSDPVNWGWLSQFCNKRLPSLPGRLVAMIIVALVFAVALAIAVPPHNRHLLGFLAVISVLWMGSSLSLMSITGERAVFNHERHLFLQLGPYVLSKLLVLLTWAEIQTALFLAVLGCLRWSFSDGAAASTFNFQNTVATCLTLFLVTAIGVVLGLSVSAFANRRKEVATFLLPLLMIGQIVFSAPISAGRPNDSLEVAYRELGWPLSVPGKLDIGNPPSTATTIDFNSSRMCASLISYFTVSRYGDIALRGINEDRDRTPHEEAAARVAVSGALQMLGVLFVGLTAVTFGILKWQSRAVPRISNPS